MTPCEKKGYKVDQIFEVTKEHHSHNFTKGTIVALSKTTSDDSPYFDLVKGQKLSCLHMAGEKTEIGGYIPLDYVQRIYPLEEKSPTVDIIVEGKTITISRESAIALNLVEE